MSSRPTYIAPPEIGGEELANLPRRGHWDGIQWAYSLELKTLQRWRSRPLLNIDLGEE
jgi:hypothetical protein